MAFIIAIDGPSASGKGTIAKMVAERLRFDYLNTGLLYRALALFVVRDRLNVSRLDIVRDVVQSLSSSMPQESDLHSSEVSTVASIVAANELVRNELLEMQRRFPEGKKGVVVEGRDIGTVIFPKADLKVYVTADLQERVERRFKQLQIRGENIIKENVLRDIKDRDARDLSRSCAPLILGNDYKLVDTTLLSVNGAVEEVLKFVDGTLL